MLKTPANINELLMDAVSTFNVKQVKFYLKNGADPNYSIRLGEEYEESFQPTTPLKMVMFRISDCMLNDEDLNKFRIIAKTLLNYGANPIPAMKIAESRYGKYNPEMESNAFSDVWHIVAKAFYSQAK